MIARAFLATFLSYSFGLNASAQTAPPSAQAILEDARWARLNAEVKAQGKLRSGETEVPLALEVGGGHMRFEFPTLDRTYDVYFTDDSNQVTTRTHKTAKLLSESATHEVLPGVHLSDIALPFLYWPNPVLQGEERMRTRPVWVVDVPAPNAKGPYGAVRLWVDQASGALLRIEAYDRGSNLVKRLEVTSGMKKEGRWMLKRLRIESFAPGERSPSVRSYLELDAA